MTKSNKAAVLAAALIFPFAAPAAAQGTTGTDTGVVTETRDRDDDSGKWGLLGLLGLAGLLGLKRRERDDYRDTRSTTGTTTGSRH
jgi:MYXO-CTERM domain-containing protein